MPRYEAAIKWLASVFAANLIIFSCTEDNNYNASNLCLKDIHCSLDKLCVKVNEWECNCVDPAQYFCPLPSNNSNVQETNSTFNSTDSTFNSTFCNSNATCSAEDEVCLRDDEKSCSCVPRNHTLCQEVLPNNNTEDVFCLSDNHCSFGKHCVRVLGRRCKCMHTTQYLCRLWSNSSQEQDTNATSNFDKPDIPCSYNKKCPVDKAVCIREADGSCRCVLMEVIHCKVKTDLDDKDKGLIPTGRINCQTNSDCISLQVCLKVTEDRCECFWRNAQSCSFLHRKERALNSTSSYGRLYSSCSSSHHCPPDNIPCVKSQTDCECVPLDEVRCNILDAKKGFAIVGYVILSVIIILILCCCGLCCCAICCLVLQKKRRSGFRRVTRYSAQGRRW